MTTIREFLTAYADRYPDKIKNREKFINKTNNLYIDYADGIFTFSKKFSTTDSRRPGIKNVDLEITGHGGHNGSFLKMKIIFIFGIIL